MGRTIIYDKKPTEEKKQDVLFERADDDLDFEIASDTADAMSVAETAFIEFVSKQVTKMDQKLLFDGNSSPPLQLIDKALMQHEHVMLALTALYEQSRWKLNAAKEAYKEWEAVKYLEVRMEVNKKEDTVAKWYKKEEIDRMVIVKYRKDNARMMAQIALADSKCSLFRRLIDSWNQYAFQLGQLSRNAIAEKNSSFCELTGLYWAWQNGIFKNNQYVGLVHYRRYFTKRSQRYSDYTSMDEVVLSRGDLDNLLSQNDVLVPKKRRYYIETLYSHYAHTLDGSHLDVARDVIKQLSPEYLTAFNKVMKQRSGYMFNMFIMKKDLANQYFSWLFPILDKMYEQIDVSQLTPFEARLFGRVSELLFNVWLKHKNIKPKEIPFMYMEKVDLFEKVKSFLMAKFFGKKYEQSF